jgi:DNA-binding transcriptional regulator YhcF (GntR family)
VVNIGDRIPSINETSEEFYLSRDTVVKAYDLLRNRGIITSVKGKGFYITSTGKNKGKRILLLFNKLSDRKKTIYNSFITNLPEDTKVDLQVHHCDPAVLEKIIIENHGKYDHYVIMPHLKEETEGVKAAINKIPKDKLIMVNKDLENIEGNYACVYEDFENDIYSGLHTGLEEIKKYSKLYLVFPKSNFYCNGIIKGNSVVKMNSSGK